MSNHLINNNICYLFPPEVRSLKKVCLAQPFSKVVFLVRHLFPL